MGHNTNTLSKDNRDAKASKKVAKPRDIPYDPQVDSNQMGYWDPNVWQQPYSQVNGNTMATHGYGNMPLYVVPNVGSARTVQPNTGLHEFPGATSYREYPKYSETVNSQHYQLENPISKNAGLNAAQKRNDNYYLDLRKQLDDIQQQALKTNNVFDQMAMRKTAGSIYQTLLSERPDLVSQEQNVGKKAGKSLLAAGKYIFPGAAPIFNAAETTTGAIEYAQDPNLSNAAGVWMDAAGMVSPNKAFQYAGDILTGNEILNSKRYGGDPSLPDLTGHYKYGGIQQFAPGGVGDGSSYVWNPTARTVPVMPHNQAATSYSKSVDYAGSEINKNIIKAKDFFNKWYDSPRYKEMIAASTEGQDGPTAQDYTNKRKDNLEHFVVDYKAFPDEQKGVAANASIQKQVAFDHPNTNTGIINFNTHNPESNAYGTAIHELSHVTDQDYWRNTKGNNILGRNAHLVNRQIPLYDQMKIKYYGRDNRDNYNPFVIDDKNFYDYVKNPTETRARLNSIRSEASDQKIYDPFNQKVTPEIYKKLQQTNFKTGEGYDPFQQLQETYTDEQLIDMLNTISQNKNQNSNKPIAKMGGIAGYNKETGLKGKRNTTSKNIKSSINKLMLRNETLYGPSGKRIYDPLVKAQDGYAVQMQQAFDQYDTDQKALAAERQRVENVRKGVIPAAMALDAADDKIRRERGAAYDAFEDSKNASNPKELREAIKNYPQELKNVLPGAGSYNIAQWESKNKAWNEDLDPSRELYCTPYGCYTYQKAGAKDVPIVGGNYGFVAGAQEGKLPFEKVNAREAQPGDMAIVYGMQPADYKSPDRDDKSTWINRPHHTTVLAEIPKFDSQGKPLGITTYNAQEGNRLFYNKDYRDRRGDAETKREPDTGYEFYRYHGQIPQMERNLNRISEIPMPSKSLSDIQLPQENIAQRDIEIPNFASQQIQKPIDTSKLNAKQKRELAAKQLYEQQTSTQNINAMNSGMKNGGIAYPQQPTENEFYQRGWVAPGPVGFYQDGGITNEIAFPQQPTANAFYQRGYVPQGPVGFYQDGGQNFTPEAFPQSPPQNIFFSGTPWSPELAYGGGLPGGSNNMPCLECGGMTDQFGGGVDQNTTLMKDGGQWIQKATASIKRRGTEGVCTGSKFGSSSCPPGSRRYNLAKTFRAMAKKAEGGEAGGVDPYDYSKQVSTNFINKLKGNTAPFIADEAAEDVHNKLEEYNEAQNPNFNQATDEREMPYAQMGMTMQDYGYNPGNIDMFQQNQNNFDLQSKRAGRNITNAGYNLFGTANPYMQWKHQQGNTAFRNNSLGMAKYGESVDGYDSRPRYKGIPMMPQAPVYRNTDQGSYDQRPVSRLIPHPAAPVYRNTDQSGYDQMPAGRGIPRIPQPAPPIYRNTDQDSYDQKPVSRGIPNMPQPAKPVYRNTDQDSYDQKPANIYKPIAARSTESESPDATSNSSSAPVNTATAKKAATSAGTSSTATSAPASTTAAAASAPAAGTPGPKGTVASGNGDYLTIAEAEKLFGPRSGWGKQQNAQTQNHYYDQWQSKPMMVGDNPYGFDMRNTQGTYKATKRWFGPGARKIEMTWGPGQGGMNNPYNQSNQSPGISYADAAGEHPLNSYRNATDPNKYPDPNADPNSPMEQYKRELWKLKGEQDSELEARQRPLAPGIYGPPTQNNYNETMAGPTGQITTPQIMNGPVINLDKNKNATIYAYGGMPMAQFGYNAMGQPDARFQGPLSSQFVDSQSKNETQLSGGDPYYHKAVGKYKHGFNKQAEADAILAGTAGLTSLANVDDANANRQRMNNMTLGPNAFSAVQGTQGNWNPTGMSYGMFNPNAMGIVEQPGMGMVKYGGGMYEEGGAYELDDDQINQILANGGSVTYI